MIFDCEVRQTTPYLLRFFTAPRSTVKEVSKEEVERALSTLMCLPSDLLEKILNELMKHFNIRKKNNKRLPFVSCSFCLL